MRMIRSIVVIAMISVIGLGFAALGRAEPEPAAAQPMNEGEGDSELVEPCDCWGYFECPNNPNVREFYGHTFCPHDPSSFEAQKACNDACSVNCVTDGLFCGE
jgi:hypothetical protein